jgi:hypothetical protein
MFSQIYISEFAHPKIKYEGYNKVMGTPQSTTVTCLRVIVLCALLPGTTTKHGEIIYQHTSKKQWNKNIIKLFPFIHL